VDEPIKLQIRNLSKVYRTDDHDVMAIDEINLAIRNKEFATILGPSGCGKSTLLRIVAGLMKPTHGMVRLDGTAIRGPGRDRGMVFQSYTLFPWLTVMENIQFGLGPPEWRRPSRSKSRKHSSRRLACEGSKRATLGRCPGG
jgi:NitT/TauT family transport system ATP-binding protein